jgi:hypothetical protein
LPLLGVVAATFGAALETTLPSGYTLAQFFDWSWGKFRRPVQAARFHLVMIVVVIVGMGVLFRAAGSPSERRRKTAGSGAIGRRRD